MFKKFLSLSAIIFLLVSCDTNKNLSEFSKDVIINKLSSYQIKEESDVSYTYDGGKKKTTLAFKTDFTFEYTYEQTYQGSRKTFVYVTGNVNFIGEVEKDTRKISFTILLNDEFEGGEFEIEAGSPANTERVHTVDLKKGDAILFPSYTWHRVKPVTKGTRHSLVGWVRGPQWR